MSNNDNRAPFHYNPFQNPNPSFFFNNNQHPSSSSSHNINGGGHQPLQNQQQLGFHENLIPSQSMSFRDFFHRSVDYNTLSEVFDMSYKSSSEVMVDHHHGNPRGTNTQQQQQQQQLVSSPLNCSVSSSSNEADPEGDRDLKISKKVKEQDGEDHLMGDKEDLGKTKKGRELKKEKREKRPKFAFLTKSEIDHLEDGYRWRKYGQKAVKNSSYPRSYYRCTTPKCTVKKQIERSYHDPSMVITTYEGQHNHVYPSSIRGSAGVGPVFGTSLIGSVMARQYDSFPRKQELLLSHLLPVSDAFVSSSSTMSQTLASQDPQMQAAAFQDDGILRDIDRFLVRKSEL